MDTDKRNGVKDWNPSRSQRAIMGSAVLSKRAGGTSLSQRNQALMIRRRRRGEGKERWLNRTSRFPSLGSKARTAKDETKGREHWALGVKPVDSECREKRRKRRKRGEGEERKGSRVREARKIFLRKGNQRAAGE